MLKNKQKSRLKFLRLGEGLTMKHKSKIIRNKKTVGEPAPKDQTAPACDSNLDQAIAEIQSRANHVGELLNGIIPAHPSPQPGVHHPR
jgi:hypothetical protein